MSTFNLLFWICFPETLKRFCVFCLHLQTKTSLQILCSPVASISSPASGKNQRSHQLDFTIYVEMTNVGTVKTVTCLSLYHHTGLRSFLQFMKLRRLISPLFTSWESQSHTGRCTEEFWLNKCTLYVPLCSFITFTNTGLISVFIIRPESSRLATRVKGRFIHFKYRTFFKNYFCKSCLWKYSQLAESSALGYFQKRATIWTFIALQITGWTINMLLVLDADTKAEITRVCCALNKEICFCVCWRDDGRV